MSINYSLSLVTAPASEPVTLAEAKTHMRIDSTDDDTYITELITAARILAENYTKRSFINTTWKMFMDRWPCSAGYGRYSEGYHEVPVTDSYQAKPVVLPKGQMQSVTHIKTYDDADTATTTVRWAEVRQRFDGKYVYPVCNDSDAVYSTEEYSNDWFPIINE